MSKLNQLVQVKDLSTGLVLTMNVKTLLDKYINADRSSAWLNYDENDWREGLFEFVPELKLEKVLK
jgi:hypothetical protein